jgi:hypothetical protein
MGRLCCAGRLLVPTLKTLTIEPPRSSHLISQLIPRTSTRLSSSQFRREPKCKLGMSENYTKNTNPHSPETFVKLPSSTFGPLDFYSRTTCQTWRVRSSR